MEQVDPTKAARTGWRGSRRSLDRIRQNCVGDQKTKEKAVRICDLSQIIRSGFGNHGGIFMTFFVSLSVWGAIWEAST